MLFYVTWFVTFTFTSTKIPINSLLHLPLSINSLHSHLHVSLFQLFLLLQTPASNLRLHVQVSCQDTYLVSLILDSILNTLTLMVLATSGTHNLAYGLLISLQLPLHLFTRTL